MGHRWLEAKEVDFLCAAHRVVVETDTRRHHRSRQAFENDRAATLRATASPRSSA